MGETGFANNLPQVFFAAKEAAPSGRLTSDLAGDASGARLGLLVSGEDGAFSSEIAVSDFSTTEGLAAKKPFRLCWPLMVLVVEGCARAFDRLGVGPETVLADRLPLSVFAFEDMLDVFEVVCESVTTSSCGEKELLTAFIVALEGGDSGRISLLSPFSCVALLDLGSDGWRVNMSLILRLLSNS